MRLSWISARRFPPNYIDTDANGTPFIETDDDLHGRGREDAKGGKCNERTVACSQIV